MMNNKVLTNTILSLSSKACAMILFFLIDIISARVLKKDAYGEWTYFYALITIIFSLAWLGINISSKIFLAKSDKKEHRKLIIASIHLRLLVSALFTIIYFIIVIGAIGFGMLEKEKYPDFGMLLLIGGVLVFLNSFSEYFKEAFNGLVNFKGVFIVNLLEYGGYVIFGYIGLLLFCNPVGLAVGYIVALVVVNVVCFYIINKKYDIFKTDIEKNKLCQEAKNVFQYAKYIAVSSIGVIILTEVDTFMLGILCDSVETAYYSIAKQLTAKAVHVNLALSASMMVMFADISYENIKQRKRQFMKAMICNGVVTGSIVVCFVVFGKIMILALYGNEYSASIIVLNYLLPYYVMNSFSKFLVLFLDYQNKAKIRSIAYWLTLLLDIVLNFILIPLYGAVGASVATNLALLPYFIFLICQVTIVFKFYSRKRIS